MSHFYGEASHMLKVTDSYLEGVFYNHHLQEEHLHVILTEASTVILVFS